MEKVNPIQRRSCAWLKCWHCPKNKPVKRYDESNPFDSPDQECSPYSRNPDECMLAFLKDLKATNRFEVVVLYGWSKFEPLGVWHKEKLAELVYRHAQMTEKYGKQFEIVILGRSLHRPDSSSHYVCRNGKVARWYESTVGMQFPTSESVG